ncbi:MAG: F0F1 ATP synthase subunit alpha [Dehalococcoidia bacterium]
MTTRSEEITSIIKQQIQQFGAGVETINVGTIIEAGDGIARISGLGGALNNELIEFPLPNGDSVMGIALNLEEDTVACVILGDYTAIVEGGEARTTGRVVEVPVGPELLGRVVNPLGEPIDGKGPINAERTRSVERIAPNVVARKSVTVPVQTGIKAVDAIIPIGRGQRELIIGDRSTGKTAIALDTIINQKGGDLYCIYVAVGQKASKVAQIVAQLEAAGAMEHTIIVSASASEAAALQYLAPYAGCAMGEDFMERGQDALIVYDDLSKHAWAYREISLLLRRPPGREAYPGDVFYLHSRLLERSARLDEALGGGSLTALPIIETQAGDVSAYIPTNVISITDGQIYLEADLFNAGQRPAVNVGISVSRVGFSAATKALKAVGNRLRLDLAQFRNVQAFAQFGTSDLDPATRRQLERGLRVVEVMKQPQYQPLGLAQQVSIIYAVNNGFLDDVPPAKVRAFEVAFHSFMASNHPEIIDAINQQKDLTPEITESLGKAIEEFKANVPY